MPHCEKYSSYLEPVKKGRRIPGAPFPLFKLQDATVSHTSECVVPPYTHFCTTFKHKRTQASLSFRLRFPCEH